jgi:hypothetical protein
MNPIHLNVAEAIIEPFWDPEISEFKEWKIDLPGMGAVSYEQTWCMVGFKWMNAAVEEDVFVMSRQYYGIDVQKADVLLVSASMRKGNHLKVAVKGNGLTASGTFVCKEDKKQEFSVNIGEFITLEEIIITVGSGTGSSGSCWFNWIGIADSSLLANYLDTKNDYGPNSWDKHLKPESFEPGYKPSYGILINEMELESIRGKAGEVKKLLQDVDDIKDFYNPEKQINDYVNFLQDTRYNRERDEGNSIL